MSARDVELAIELRNAIEQRLLGQAVSAASGSGRSISYSAAPLEHLIHFYRQIRRRLSAQDLAQHELPEYQTPNTPIAEGRRRPAYYRAAP